jgi:SAM-dependent methyltransferase
MSSPKYKTTTRRCPICNFKKGELLHFQSFKLPEDHVLPESYDLVSCVNCGFVFADTSASQKDYDRFYRDFSKYEDRSISTGSGARVYDKNRLEITARAIGKVIKDKNASILDIGSGNGGLLIALKRICFKDLTGLDPSKKCVEIMKEAGLKAIQGGLFDNAIKLKYDCIILSHVLEHIYDLKRAIKNINKWASKKAIIYAEVPDASRYHDHFVVPYYYFDIEHINHFDSNSLKNLFSGTFSPVGIGQKDLQVSDRLKYPAGFAIFRKTPQVNGKNKLKYSSKARNSIIKYIQISKKHYNFPELDELASSKEPIIVWGAGNFTTRLLENSALNKCNIVAFVDKDPKKQGGTLNKVKIYSPAILRTKSYPIVISSAVFADQIMHEILHLGLGNRIIILQ